MRRSRVAARWEATGAHAGRRDLPANGWCRQSATTTLANERDFAQYNVPPAVPAYDHATYEKHLTSDTWSREETDYLMDTYRDGRGKWPVVHDHYDFGGIERSMEDLKARYYSISATLLQLATPITSMTASEYGLYEVLSNFDAKQEESRKKLAEGHLYRRANEVDEETVLLGELQRIMLNQATLDNQREELRRRLDYPLSSTNATQYSTSQQLTTLWQTLLQQDRFKKNPRLRPTGNPSYDGFALPGHTPTAATRPRTSLDASEAPSGTNQRRPTRDSLPSATPQSALPSDLSKSDMLRYGVVQAPPDQKLPSGVTFASDKLAKPRIAKSTIQSEKIAAILQNIGVPEIIPLPTAPVVAVFEDIMAKVHTLLDMRKVAEKEEQELRVRQAEA